MWLFGKKEKDAPRKAVANVPVQYDTRLKRWTLSWDGIEFNVSGMPFNEEARKWACEAAPIIVTLEPDIRARVASCLQGSGRDHNAAILSGVNLDAYGNSRMMALLFTGNSTWRGTQVTVIVADGKIREAVESQAISSTRDITRNWQK